MLLLTTPFGTASQHHKICVSFCWLCAEGALTQQNPKPHAATNSSWLRLLLWARSHACQKGAILLSLQLMCHTPCAQERDPTTAAQARRGPPSWCRAALPRNCDTSPAPAAGPVLILGNSADLVLQSQGDSFGVRGSDHMVVHALCSGEGRRTCHTAAASWA